jgi:mediator of RNA polymerase II transcription subunit 13, fungi type
MSSKPSVISPSSSGSVALAQYPPSIDLSNKLLSSAIPLPPHASIVYVIFSPTTSALHPDTIELARRRILDTRKPSILDSLLCTVYVEKGVQQLYVFLVGSSDGANDLLSNLQFDGLIRESSESIIQSLRTAPFDLCLGDSSSFAGWY